MKVLLHICFVLLICLFSCTPHKNRGDHDKEYSFYSKENYFYDSVKSNSYTLDSTSFPPPFFIMLDEVGFLNASGYSSYMVYVKNFPYSNLIIVTSLKTLRNSNSNILNISKIVYENESVDLKQSIYEWILEHQYMLSKNSRSINADTTILIRKQLDSLAMNISTYADRENDHGSGAIFYFDGKKYYILNDGYLASGSISKFNDYLLDSVLGLDAHFALDKTVP